MKKRIKKCEVGKEENVGRDDVQSLKQRVFVCYIYNIRRESWVFVDFPIAAII